MAQQSEEAIRQQIVDLKAQLFLIKKKEKEGPKPDRNSPCICDICKGKYTLQNKSTHNKTQKHQAAFENMKDLRRLARSRTLEGRAGAPD